MSILESRSYKELKRAREVSRCDSDEDLDLVVAGEFQGDFLDIPHSSDIPKHQLSRNMYISMAALLLIAGASFGATKLAESMQQPSDASTQGVVSFVEDPKEFCEKHRGLLHPGDDKCCARACGEKYCGTPLCSEGPGGYESCCKTKIDKFCSDAVAAPCMIPPVTTTPLPPTTTITTTTKCDTKECIAKQICKKHGGIEHPGFGKCCAPGCGERYCGAKDCHNGPGGVLACCIKAVQETCAGSAVAPCMIPGSEPSNAGDPFAGMDKMLSSIVFRAGNSVTSGTAKAAVSKTLAPIFGLPPAQISVSDALDSQGVWTVNFMVVVTKGEAGRVATLASSITDPVSQKTFAQSLKSELGTNSFEFLSFTPPDATVLAQ